MTDKEIIGFALDEYVYLDKDTGRLDNFSDFVDDDDYYGGDLEVIGYGEDMYVEISLRALIVKVHNVDSKPEPSNYFSVYKDLGTGELEMVLKNVTLDEAVEIYESM